MSSYSANSIDSTQAHHILEEVEAFIIANKMPKENRDYKTFIKSFIAHYLDLQKVQNHLRDDAILIYKTSLLIETRMKEVMLKNLQYLENNPDCLRVQFMITDYEFANTLRIIYVIFVLNIEWLIGHPVIQICINHYKSKQKNTKKIYSWLMSPIVYLFYGIFDLFKSPYVRDPIIRNLCMFYSILIIWPVIIYRAYLFCWPPIQCQNAWCGIETFLDICLFVWFLSYLIQELTQLVNESSIFMKQRNSSGSYFSRLGTKFNFSFLDLNRPMIRKGRLTKPRNQLSNNLNFADRPTTEKANSPMKIIIETNTTSYSGSLKSSQNKKSNFVKSQVSEDGISIQSGSDQHADSAIHESTENLTGVAAKVNLDYQEKVKGNQPNLNRSLGTILSYNSETVFEEAETQPSVIIQDGKNHSFQFKDLGQVKFEPAFLESKNDQQQPSLRHRKNMLENAVRRKSESEKEMEPKEEAQNDSGIAASNLDIPRVIEVKSISEIKQKVKSINSLDTTPRTTVESQTVINLPIAVANSPQIQQPERIPKPSMVCLRKPYERRRSLHSVSFNMKNTKIKDGQDNELTVDGSQLSHQKEFIDYAPTPTPAKLKELKKQLSVRAINLRRPEPAHKRKKSIYEKSIRVIADTIPEDSNSRYFRNYWNQVDLSILLAMFVYFICILNQGTVAFELGLLSFYGYTVLIAFRLFEYLSTMVTSISPFIHSFMAMWKDIIIFLVIVAILAFSNSIGLSVMMCRNTNQTENARTFQVSRDKISDNSFYESLPFDNEYWNCIVSLFWYLFLKPLGVGVTVVDMAANDSSRTNEEFWNEKLQSNSPQLQHTITFVIAIYYICTAFCLLRGVIVKFVVTNKQEALDKAKYRNIRHQLQIMFSQIDTGYPIPWNLVHIIFSLISETCSSCIQKLKIKICKFWRKFCNFLQIKVFCCFCQNSEEYDPSFSELSQNQVSKSEIVITKIQAGKHNFAADMV